MSKFVPEAPEWRATFWLSVALVPLGLYCLFTGVERKSIEYVLTGIVISGWLLAVAIVKNEKEAKREQGSGPSMKNRILDVCGRCLLDVGAFVVAPLFFYGALLATHTVGDDAGQALITALVTSGIAYVGAFAFHGGYTGLGFRQRLAIMLPALLLATIYWLGLTSTRIADGYGDGNVHAMLFGLAVTGIIAWHRVKVARQA